MAHTDSGMELHDRFAIPGVLRIGAGNGELPCITVTAEPASAEIYLHGAHVTHFQPRGSTPLLFMSKSSQFAPGKPIRGGIPLIFPWFGARASDKTSPAHGFARLMPWDIESADLRADGSVRVVLTLASDDATLAQWPHAFSLRLIVIVASFLDITLEIRNRSAQEMQFEEAMHTYLKVGNIRQTTVEGLADVELVDKVAAGERRKESSEPIRFLGETDRVYLHTTSATTVRDVANSRLITVEKEGSDATVVWNPWIAKAKAMADFGDEEWPDMLCIESANALDCVVTLAPSATHRMRAKISVAPL